MSLRARATVSGEALSHFQEEIASTPPGSRNDRLKQKRLVQSEDEALTSRYHLNSLFLARSVADVFISLRYNGAHP